MLEETLQEHPPRRAGQRQPEAGPLALGVILPYTVGKWWYGTQRMTKDKILIQSAGKLFRDYRPDQDEGSVIGALSCGDEFTDVLEGHKAESGLSTIERKVLSDESPVLSALSKADRTKIEHLEDSRRRKVLTLLWAFLGRIELDDAALNEEKFAVAPIAHKLNEAYSSMALAYGATKGILSTYHTSQNLIQALRPGASPLEQLPYFTPAVAAAAEANKSKTHLTVQEFMRIPVKERKARVVAPGLLTEEQYNQAISVASQLLVLQVEKNNLLQV